MHCFAIASNFVGDFLTRGARVGIGGVGIEEAGAEFRGETQFEIEGFVNVRLECELQ